MTHQSLIRRHLERESEVPVGAPVVLQMPGLAELARADVALEGPHPGVNLNVPIAVAVAGKRLPAHRTAERPLPEVLRVVQGVLQAVVAGKAAVGAAVAAADDITAVPQKLVLSDQLHAARGAAHLGLAPVGRLPLHHRLVRGRHALGSCHGAARKERMHRYGKADRNETCISV